MKKYVLLIFLFFQILFLQFLKQNPNLVETYYSNFVYQKISFVSRSIFGLLPFSVGDCFYGALIMATPFWIYSKRKTWRLSWKSNILSIINFLSVIYFAFYLLWGYNYYRVSLADKMTIDTVYTEQELIVFTENLIQTANQTHYYIVKNKFGKVTVPYTTKRLFNLCSSGYKKLSAKHPTFAHKHQATKASIYSVPLSYMGFGGYLNPFTNEAQINTEMPKYSFAMTASHEMAHQAGFASESECNFIGYLAASSSEDLYVQYSAQSFALKYCMSIIKMIKPSKFKQLKAKINPGIIQNFKESETFWKTHESVIETGFKIFYDQFLKTNQQKDGLEGYGKFLNLLIGFERKNISTIYYSNR